MASCRFTISQISRRVRSVRSVFYVLVIVAAIGASWSVWWATGGVGEARSGELKICVAAADPGMSASALRAVASTAPRLRDSYETMRQDFSARGAGEALPAFAPPAVGSCVEGFEPASLEQTRDRRPVRQDRTVAMPDVNIRVFVVDDRNLMLGGQSWMRTPYQLYCPTGGSVCGEVATAVYVGVSALSDPNVLFAVL